ncbi:pyridoxal-dependent decarboxylase, exosortase A system-associated [Betaproteobacteria bacterium]|nr:pyridoxal-dependent decarboxylase, exosortase A system-associated [Betaproteobacteria bacterium]GHU22911.1 pyridoxal-dependent decarboxylase, exosortase A system-associated [Betaproteobacteria bacterium]GHU27451.1 pyridoxal-dependent decarboxylase, exosortase A system-associated [Betaproteobacteria bacterium]
MSTSPAHAPMDQFAHAEGELLIGGLPLSRLAARIGRTPFYACDRALISRRIKDLRTLLPPQVKLHYALKANPMPALASHLAPLVDGVDIASGGELKLALDAGIAPRNISFAGPGKTEAELFQSVAAGILIHVESAREVHLLAQAARTLRLPARVAVRVNPDFELKSAGMKMGGGPKPFGVDAAQVPAILAEISAAALAFEGFHFFPGSQNLSSAAIIDAQQKSFALARKLAACAPGSAPIQSINLGGGFGIPYFPGEQRLDCAPIAANLATLVAQAAQVFPHAELVIELGRYLVGEAGIYVCRVLDRKISHDQIFLVTDGGLHQHLPASGNFGQVLRKNYPVAIGKRMHEPPTETVTLVGPLCTPLDVLAQRIQLPHAETGDLVVIFQSGAYGATASPQAFLGHPPVTEVLV